MKYETSTPEIPAIRGSCCGRTHVFTRRNGGDLPLEPYHDGRAVPGGQFGRCNGAGSCRTNEKLACLVQGIQDGGLRHFRDLYEKLQLEMSARDSWSKEC
jgi:hypothetical protein